MSGFQGDKVLVFFGSGAIAEKYLYLKPAFIVDNNKDLQGTEYQGFSVVSPDILKESVAKYEILICTTSVSEVRAQLTGMGYVWEKDINVASSLKERLAIADLEDARYSFLISSGLPSHVQDLAGGGVFLIQETEGYPQVEKIYSGNTHGLIKFQDGYAFTSQGEGVVVVGEDLEVKKVIPLPENIRPHGLRRYGDSWLVVASYQDVLIQIDDVGKEVKRYPFSTKLESFGSPQHHCNDVDIVGEYAYVSMFSVTGNWKRNVFDGGIIEVNLYTGEQKVICNNLTMPHNVTVDNDGLKVLNSFKGELLINNMENAGVFPGFSRGYDQDGQYHFVGESKNRNFSRLETGRKPVSIDSRITVVNKEYGFSRSLCLPRTISEIHSLIKL